MSKYIFVTGGVVSGLGKGIAAASIGLLLKNRGYNISVIKLDPYINVDPGTMSPYQHGEVFVTEDGAETDLDLGHYERFINIELSKYSSCSSGQIYSEVIQQERKGLFLGGTVQVVPHITNAIKKRIQKVSDTTNADIVLVEIGGTVGDMESQPFLEAIRQFRNDVGKDHTLFVHLTYIPYLKTNRELKTKPTQHSVKELQRNGIQPDILICRTEIPIPEELKLKIATFCDVAPSSVFEGIDVDSIYSIPINFHEIGIDDRIAELLKLSKPKSDISKWKKLVYNYTHPRKEVKIAIVGKYVKLPDAYLSIIESLKHAGAHNGVKIDIIWVDAEEVEENGAEYYLKDVNGILVPGGFGSRGIEGKIAACKYARENNIPYLGICLGMQIAVIEFARNVCGLEGASSAEFGENEHPVIHIMEHQKEIEDKGGTMRLGAYPCLLHEQSKSQKYYNIPLISERHRHRYEVNNDYRKVLEENGLLIAGTSPDGELVEIIEYPKNSWFVACQFHPEFKSRVEEPHPLFLGFIEHATQYKNKRKER